LSEVASTNDIISPSELAAIANYLGLLYNQALLGIELNDHGGHTAMNLLDEVYRYPNLYFDPEQDPSNIRYGWVTNRTSKGHMITTARELLYDRQTVINSVQLLSQLKTYVQLGPDKFGALPGKKDDLATAWMIALQIAQAVHIPRPFDPRTGPPKGSPDYIIAQLKARMNRNPFNRTGYGS
jgi:hypothetical protein